jgi:hypothetical protein
MINPERFRPWKIRYRTCQIPPYACNPAGGAPRSVGRLLRMVRHQQPR